MNGVNLYTEITERRTAAERRQIDLDLDDAIERRQEVRRFDDQPIPADDHDVSNVQLDVRIAAMRRSGRCDSELVRLIVLRAQRHLTERGYL